MTNGSGGNDPRPVLNITAFEDAAMSDVQTKPTAVDFKDLGGQVFGRLLVLSYAGKASWNARCECGVLKTIRSNHLISGRSRSCGCLSREMTAARRRSHGESCGGKVSAEYAAWSKMKSRCYDENDKEYHNYGGRGIQVSQRWVDSFENFLADVGRRPTARHSLDRYPDQNGDYSPGNVRWATLKEQGRNKRTNKLLSFGGRTQCLSAWAEELGIDQNTLGMRLLGGWSVERALTTPLQKRAV